MLAVKPIPDGYHTVTPYLIVGDGDGAIAFYKGLRRERAHAAYDAGRQDRPCRADDRRLDDHAGR